MPGQEAQISNNTERNRRLRKLRIDRRREGKKELQETLKREQEKNEILKAENSILKKEVEKLTQKILDLTKDLKLARSEIEGLGNLVLEI